MKCEFHEDDDFNTKKHIIRGFPDSPSYFKSIKDIGQARHFCLRNADRLVGGNSNFSKLNNDILNEIFSALNPKDLARSRELSKDFNELILKLGKYKEDTKTRDMKNNIPGFQFIPEAVIDAVGGLEALSKLPVLDLPPITPLPTHLDFIKPEEMTAPIMRGIDSAGRPFIALKVLDKDNSPAVMTFFTRYGGSDIFEHCGVNGSKEFFCDGELSKESITNLKKFIKDRQLVTSDNSFTLKLMDEKENAV